MMASSRSDVPNHRSLALFLAGNVCLAAGLFVHAFLFNFYLRELGLPASVMGYQAAAITCGGLIALFPTGLLIDRRGWRPALLAGVSVTVAGLALTAVARRPAMMYPAALLIGVGGAACRITWGPALMRLTSRDDRARAFTWNVALLVGTGGAWTLLAGVLPSWSEQLGRLAGWSGTQVTLLAGAVVSAGAGVCYLALPSIHTTTRESVRVSLAPPREVRTLLPLIALWMLAAALVLPFFNVYFLDRFQLPVSRIAGLFAAAQLAHAVLLMGAAELARRWGTRRALTAWMLALAPALWWLAATGSLGMAIGLYLVQGLIAPATNPLIDQLLLERAPHEQHGVVAGWRNATVEGAGAIGASAGGRVLEASTFSALFVISGAIAAISSALLGFALRGRTTPSIARDAEAA